MNTYFRLLGFTKPLGPFIGTYFFFSLFSIVFGLLNFTLLIPLLDVLFNSTGVEAPVGGPPAFSLSADYAIDTFNYYFSRTVSQQGPMAALQMVCAVIMGSVFLANLFTYLSRRTAEDFKTRTIYNIRRQLFDKILSLEVGFYTNQRKGDVIARTMNDSYEIESALCDSIVAFIKDTIHLIAFFVLLFRLSVELTLFTLIIIPLSGSIIAVIVKQLRKDAQQAQQSQSMLISLLDETLGGLRVILGFNATEYVRRRFDGENSRYVKHVRSLAFKRELAPPFSEFAGIAVVAGILLYGGSLVLGGDTTLRASTFITYIAVFSQVLRPAKSIISAFGSVQRSIVAGQRVLALIDTQPTITDRPGAIIPPTFSSAIEFQEVSFAYEERQVLQQVSFRIERGKTIALVGPSGGGKSTIADLIPRFYDVQSGQILIDGVDVRDCQLDGLRQQMGIVTQESVLFNDTIFNNIAFGMERVSEEQVIQAAKVANAHEFIMATEQGYQTVIGDRGTKLSGGQRQRLSIARAVLKNPPILLLDEATSALDTESEKLVQEALYQLLKNRTSLVIAHRLSTIRHADEILVIEQGQIVERGTHEALMQMEGGLYRKLSLLQGEREP